MTQQEITLVNDKYFLEHARKLNYTFTEDGRIFNGKGKEIAKTYTRNAYLVLSTHDNTGRKRQIKKHRLVYLHYKGIIPLNYVVDHVDGDPINNSIKNLEAITPFVNVQRYLARGIARQVFTDEVAINIIKLASAGISRNQLSYQFSVRKPTIDNLLSGRTYKHLDRTDYDAFCKNRLTLS